MEQWAVEGIDRDDGFGSRTGIDTPQIFGVSGKDY